MVEIDPKFNYECIKKREVKERRCQYLLTTHCLEKSAGWSEWRREAIAFSGQEIVSHYSNWYHPVFWKKRRGKHYYSLNIKNDQVVKLWIREKIAEKLGRSIDNIHEEVDLPHEGRGEGELSEGDAGDTRKWDRYILVIN